MMPPPGSKWLLVEESTSSSSSSSLAAIQPASAGVSLATPAQLAALSYVPSGMLNKSKHARRTKPRKTAPLVKDGQTVSKCFNPVAGRPMPALTSLEQGITVTLNLVVSSLTSSVTVPVYGNAYFTLSQCATASTYTSLFDQYRIDQIEVWVEPLSDTTAVATVGLATCIDLDDANAPTTYSDVADRQGALLATTLVGHYHKFKPHIAVATYSGAFTSFANEAAGWIDVASPAVQHYGLKIATQGADGATRQLLVTARAVVSFRAPAI